MPITLGNDTITGLGVGGLPDGTVNTADLADQAVTIGKVDTSVSQLFGMRNRIINGDMRIAQRGTAAVTLGVLGDYPVDRWRCDEVSDGAATGQQVQDAPVGFIDSLKITTTTADGTLSSSQYMAANQFVEGFNTADFGWGTANAKTVTLSFLVKSSLTGTFAAGIDNNAGNRSYVFNYTISAANTWEYKTVTIAGDTSGTWNTTNARGLGLRFGLGSGTDFDGTVGAWQSGSKFSSSGAVSVIGTLNATWQITGVQLEVGSVATPFERRQYGTELSLCQRYYNKTYNSSVVPGTSTSVGAVGGTATGQANRPIPYRAFPVEMRTTPSITLYSPNTGASGKVRNDNSGTDLDALAYNVGATGTRFYPPSTPSLGDDVLAHVVAAAEL
jgi:hypothetical protein